MCTALLNSIYLLKIRIINFKLILELHIKELYVKSYIKKRNSWHNTTTLTKVIFRSVFFGRFKNMCGTGCLQKDLKFDYSITIRKICL